jgi:hypothetical protein
MLALVYSAATRRLRHCLPKGNVMPAHPAQSSDHDDRCCANCGVSLQGPYCYRCGQPTRSFIRALPGLIREIAADTLYYDSRMWRTLAALLFKPGRLSAEYVHGRRARYTPPIRVYLVCSILAFLVVGLVIDTENVGLFQGGFTGEVEEADQDWQSGEIPDFVFNDQRWHAEDNPVEIGWLGEAGNAWLNRQIETLAVNSQQAGQDPRRFVRSALGLLPQTMFVLLPLFSALVAVFYLFARRYYIEHLLLQVHNHSFIFLSLTGLYLLAVARGTLVDGDWAGSQLLAAPLTLLAILAWVWIPAYLLLSLKRFYRQGWLLTLSKFLVLGWLYFILLLFALVAIIILGVLRL